ncbi:MAG: extracellular solute-binding protein [Candidatus Liberibacter ctenarytainae]|uniref:Extracellular solute-binding protein n=1 Tax=Candidatus Liberibacter ctenarytainae TaxID=2020335 RepID=A0A937DGW5_9HYPH|nr:extracellular solute-binding protein [Candidatus Liberibacter ctenarytainae]
MFKNVFYAFILSFLNFTIAFAENTIPSLILYTDRSQNIMLPIFQSFEQITGIKINPQYTSNSEISNLIQKENNNFADLIVTEDVTPLILNEDHLYKIPSGLTKKTYINSKNNSKKWIITSVYAQVLVYSTERIGRGDIPKSIFDIINKKWKKRISISPNNSSFQKILNTMQINFNHDKVRAFIEGLAINETQHYLRDADLIRSLENGKVDISLIDSRSLIYFRQQDQKNSVSTASFLDGDIGNIPSMSGAGVLQSSKKKVMALKFLRFMLSPLIQQYLVATLGEYPVVKGIIVNPMLNNIIHAEGLYPEFDSKNLPDTQTTQKILIDYGFLPKIN